MDDELRILNAAEMPAALDVLDDRVLHLLGARQREAAAMRRTIALAAFISLGGALSPEACSFRPRSRQAR